MDEMTPNQGIPQPQLTSGQKVRDFLLGFFGWWVINGICSMINVLPSLLMVQYPTTFSDTTPFALASNVLGCIWLLLNLAVLILLAFKRRWAAFGMLAAFGAALCLVILAALVFGVVCFGLLWQSGV